MEYPKIAILKNGEQITNLNHPLFNHYHVSITNCTLALKRDNVDLNTTIYVMEEADKVFAETLDGKTYTFLG